MLVIQPTWPITNHRIDCLCIWNGRKKNYRVTMDGCRKTGTPVLFLEAGFFDRAWRTQADWRGWNMTASWHSKLATPAPPEGAARFAEAWGRPAVPVTNRDGYVLVLGQVGGDAQLRDAEMHNDTELAWLVSRCLPGHDLRLRRHPKIDPGTAWSGPLPLIGGTLEEAIAGAAFVVTINSNSAHEALALGCPVMSFGPALYQLPGVTLPATMATAGECLKKMLDGPDWDAEWIQNYLYWLACRQWTQAEFSEGSVIRSRVDEAIAHATQA